MPLLRQLSRTLVLSATLSFTVVATVTAEGETTAEPQASGFDYEAALKTSQAALGNQVQDYVFTDSRGDSMTLHELTGGPLVVSLVYTSCHQICPLTTRHLAKMVEKSRKAVGDESFAVAVIGFDTRFDTPDAMRHFATRQGIDDHRWHFLSISGDQVDALMQDLGFVYVPSSSGFDHLIQATVLDSDGKVYRQVYGQTFETPMLVDPLIELVLGRPQSADSLLTELGRKIKLYCTTYDPVRDGYYFDYSLFLGLLIGAVIILVTGMFMYREHQGRQHRS